MRCIITTGNEVKTYFLLNDHDFPFSNVAIAGEPFLVPCSRGLRKLVRRPDCHRCDQPSSLYWKVYSAISKMVWRIFVAFLCQKLALCKCFTSFGWERKRENKMFLAPICIESWSELISADLTWCDMSWLQLIWPAVMLADISWYLLMSGFDLPLIPHFWCTTSETICWWFHNIPHFQSFPDIDHKFQLKTIVVRVPNRELHLWQSSIFVDLVDPCELRFLSLKFFTYI